MKCVYVAVRDLHRQDVTSALRAVRRAAALVLLVMCGVWSSQLEAAPPCVEGTCTAKGRCEDIWSDSASQFVGERYVSGVALSDCCIGGELHERLVPCLAKVFEFDITLGASRYEAKSIGEFQWNLDTTSIDVGTRVRPRYLGGMRFEPRFNVGLGIARADVSSPGRRPLTLFDGSGTLLTAGGELYVTPSPRSRFAFGAGAKYRTLIDSARYRTAEGDLSVVSDLGYRAVEADLGLRYTLLADRMNARLGGRFTRSVANIDRSIFPYGAAPFTLDLDTKQVVGGVDIRMGRDFTTSFEAASDGDDYQLNAAVTFHLPQRPRLDACAPIAPAGKTSATLGCRIDKYPATTAVGRKETFSGTVDTSDFEKCDPSVKWTSSLDGLIGYGLSIVTTLTAGSHEICLVAGPLNAGDCDGEFCKQCVAVQVEKRPVDPPVPAGTWCGKDAAWWTEEIASGRRGYRNAMGTTEKEVRGNEEQLSELILGNGAANVIEGKAGDDCIYGFGGDDRLYGDHTGIPGVTGDGRSGKDEIHGGDGNDSIWGDAKDDRLFGDAGHDRLKGDAGNDVVDGGTGNDFVMGDSGRDQLRGGAGDDRLCGNSGRDTLDGGAGTDACRTGGGRKETQTACESGLRYTDCTAKAWNAWQPGGQTTVASCPGLRKKLGELNAKPVCKALPHARIKKKNCSNKGGAMWNGYCIWDKEGWYRARMLK